MEYCPNLTDAGVSHLATHTRLKVVNFSGCTLLTDGCLVHFETMTSLESVYLRSCSKITKAAVSDFKKSRPGVSVIV